MFPSQVASSRGGRVVNRAKARWKRKSRRKTQVEKRKKMGDERKVKERRLGVGGREEESCTMETERRKRGR